MWNSWAKFDRLKEALRYRGIDPSALSLHQLMRVLSKRATDRNLNDWIWQLLLFLEPPSCQMSHCEHYGHSLAFCGCSDGKIPGRCAKYRAFKKRRTEKEQKKQEAIP